MHVRRVEILASQFPLTDRYPYDQELLRQTPGIDFERPVTFFAGRNGSGKSTVLDAVARACRVHLWRNADRLPMDANPYRDSLHCYLRVQWCNGPVPGASFSSGHFDHFAHTVDAWASQDRGVLDYYGGRSLLVQSHGQAILAYLQARCARPGLYFLDEPETALSPASQVAFVRMLRDAAARGDAQFVIATHSPILLACPGADILSFDSAPVQRTPYAETAAVRLYRHFLQDPAQALDSLLA